MHYHGLSMKLFAAMHLGNNGPSFPLVAISVTSFKDNCGDRMCLEWARSIRDAIDNHVCGGSRLPRRHIYRRHFLMRLIELSMLCMYITRAISGINTSANLIKISCIESIGWKKMCIFCALELTLNQIWKIHIWIYNEM